MPFKEILEAVNSKDNVALARIIGGLTSSISESHEKPPLCPKCNDRLLILYTDEKGYSRSKDCECAPVQRARRIMERSGLIETLGIQSFDSFHVEPGKPWQGKLLDMMKAFTKECIAGGKPWAFVGGTPGCGKTHLCTATCGELMNSRIPVRYMKWTEEIQTIKSARDDMDELQKLIEPLKKTPVLYIDDLFKGPARSGPKATEADITRAFEIINERYIQSLTTIISCEYDLPTLLDIDEATFSRVKQKCASYVVYVEPGKGKNYRLSD